MRNLIFGLANSLDNYIARVDHSVDWLQWSDDVAEITAELWPTLDTVLMGRKTYEAALSMGMRAYPDVTNYVFSRTLRQEDYPEVQIVADDAVGFTRELKMRDGRDICVIGGGELARDLFEADLIDEIGLNIHPVILGGGVPLFLEMQREVPLQLQQVRQLKGDCVLLRYRVRRGGVTEMVKGVSNRVCD